MKILNSIKHSVSILESTSNVDFEFIEDIKIITKTDRFLSFYNPIVENINKSDIIEKSKSFDVLTYISDKRKLFFTIQPNLYHFLTDSAAVILKFAEDNPDVKFYIDVKNMSKSDTDMCNFFFKILNDNDIEFELLDFSNINYIICNNSFILRTSNNFFNAPEYIYKYYSRYCNKKTSVDKKVYLSRKLNLNKQPFINNETNTTSIKDDIRIKNEHLLEDFFKQNGFEIVYPESFKSFEEQVIFFSQVKTLVSPTGAGLTNLYFMPKGGNIIELSTPLLVSFKNNTEYNIEMHHFYQLACYYRKHYYISIPNNSRDSNDIIYNITKNKIFNIIVE